MSDRRQYEEAVVFGGVFSPALLLALPFLKESLYVVIALVSCSVILLITAGGAILFGRRQSDPRSIQRWRFLIALLLCGAFFFFTVSLANLVAGPWPAAILAALMFATIAGALVLSRTTGAPRGPAVVDTQEIGRVTAIGAAVGSVVLGFLGDASVAVVVGILHMLLAIITGLVAFIAYRRLPTEG